MILLLSPDVPMSSTAGIVQDKLGCSDCGAFDINAVCAGWVHALDVARDLLELQDRNVLVIGLKSAHEFELATFYVCYIWR